MNNEQFLIFSYFIVCALVIAVALAVYAYLRHALAGMTQTFRNSHLGVILKELFPVGLVLPALAGFLSVNYRSCMESYATIIADRSYLVERNQEQVMRACLFLMVALLVWGVLVLISLATRPENPVAGREAEQDPH